MNKVAMIRTGCAAFAVFFTLCGIAQARPHSQTGSQTLEQAFADPPRSAQPWVWWRWLNGAASKEGITRDLEAMRDKGIGGAVVFDSGEVSRSVQKGPPFMSDAWRELFKHAVQEAHRCGIVLSANLCSGWSAGGPWVPRKYARQYIWGSREYFTGPQQISHTFKPSGPVIAVLAAPVTPKTKGMPASREMIWDASKAIDVSSFMQADGTVVWDVPQGEWILLQIGHRSSNHLISNVGGGPRGLSIDRHSAEAVELHFAETGAKMAADAGPLVGTTLQYFQTDSLEQPYLWRKRWTPTLREEFIKRRGYDPLLQLPTLVGYSLAVDDDRFRKDYYLTMADLLADNFYGHMRRLTVEAGLVGTASEAGLPSSFPNDPLKCLGTQDVPMAEFWKRIHEPDGEKQYGEKNETFIKILSSAAHIYGKPVNQAEAFTSLADTFTETPWNMKDIGDQAFSRGLTRIVFHSFTHQVDHSRKPGIYWPHIGIDLTPNSTWWPLAQDWLRYLARCQHMLRQGFHVADVACLVTDDVPSLPAGNNIPRQKGMMSPVYGYDYINSDVLLNRAAVKDGRLVLPDGMSYGYLLLPPEKEYLAPGTLQRIHELAAQGLKVIGPEKHSAHGVQFHSIESAIGSLAPDIELTNGSPEAALDWIHRRDQGTDIYFLSNQSKDLEGEVTAELSFRVNGMQPELWDPITGETRLLNEYEALPDGRIKLPMTFAPRQSFFVVFRNPLPSDQNGRDPNFPEWTPALQLTGPWNVTFDKEWFYGGSEADRSHVQTFSTLTDWTERPEEEIKYFSGIAVYRKTFDFPASQQTADKGLSLHLGEVNDLASVRLNGQDLGVLWTAPWQVKIPDGLLKEKGNTLEISVANRWPNRLIGDGLLPADERRTSTNIKIYEPKLEPSSSHTLKWAQSKCTQCKERIEKELPPRLLPSGLLGPVSILVKQ